MVDIKSIEYDVHLTTEDGTRHLLNEALVLLEWEELENELAQRATITVANFQIGKTYLHLMAKINCIIQITAKWNGGKQLVFDGTIWEWQYVSAVNKELTIVAYDMLIRLQQSKDFFYKSPGFTTQAIIGEICGDWGIPLEYKWGQNVTHGKKVFSGMEISEMIIELLEEVRQKTGERYVAYFRDGQLQINGYGANETIYRFDGTNTVSTMNKLTINELVTRVKIIGRENSDGRAPVDAIVDGDTRYGVLQEIIRRDANTTLAAAMSEANALIQERGKPEEIIQVAVPDLPFLRKGDRVEIRAGNLTNPFYFVDGVSHYGTTRQMTLTVSRAPRP